MRLRAGLCGDVVSGRDHLLGGKYFDGGRLSAEFPQGSVIDMVMGISAHHNGFIEAYLCDVSKCTPKGDISRDCFDNGHCTKLLRSKDAKEDALCQAGYMKKCGPVDRYNPGRWYLPCFSEGRKRKTFDKGGRYVTYGPGTIRYKLPDHVTCEHCVLQWYWSAANNCNPPGVVEYFEGEDRPRNWGRCRGEGGAKGGYTAVQETCGKKKQPEEYYMCSDIRIVKRERRKNTRGNPGPVEPEPMSDTNVLPLPEKVPQPDPTPTSTATATTTPSPTKSPPPPQQVSKPPTTTTADEYKPRRSSRFGAIQDVLLIRNGRRIQSLHRDPFVKYDPTAKYTIEATVTDTTESVDFQILDRSTDSTLVDERQTRGARDGRIYLFGSRVKTGRAYEWKGFPIGRLLTVKVSAKDERRMDRDRVYVQFVA